MAQFLWKPGAKVPKHDRPVVVAFRYAIEGTYPYPLGGYYVKFSRYVNGEWTGTAGVTPYAWSNIPAVSLPTPEPFNPPIPIPTPPGA